MTTITALVDNVHIPIIVGFTEVGHLLLKGQSFQIPTDLWNMQDIAQQMVVTGQIKAV